MSLYEDKANEIAVGNLTSVMRDAQTSIAQESARLIKQPYTQAQLNAALAKIKKVYSTIPKEWERYAKSTLPPKYEAAAKFAERVMKNSGLNRMATKSTKHTVTALIEDSVASMELASAGGMMNVERLFRETQQNYLKEERINKLIADGIIEGNPQRIKSTLQKELEKKIIGDEKVLQVGTKSYTAADYSELVARTRTREAQSEGAIATILEYGQDLVQISEHDTDSEICQEYEGNIYSLTGRSQGYPILDQSPPFHPNSLRGDTEIHTVSETGWVSIKDIVEDPNNYPLIWTTQPNGGLDKTSISRDAYQYPMVFQHTVERWIRIHNHIIGLDVYMTLDHKQPIWNMQTGEFLGFAEAHTLSSLTQSTHAFRIGGHKSRFSDELLPLDVFSFDEVEEPGVAYCMTLEKHHLMMVRAKGEAFFWTGNCQHVIVPYIEAA